MHKQQDFKLSESLHKLPVLFHVEPDM